MSIEEINVDHFKTMGELLEHLKMWEKDDDYDAYYRFFCPRCAYEMAHKIEKQSKVIDLMAEKLLEYSDLFNYEHSMTEEKLKEIFYEKAEKE